MAGRRIVGALGALWGVGGVLYLLTDAVFRLARIALEALSSELTWLHWSMLAIWVPVMLWSEAYRGFHQSFSPRVVSRALYLYRHPTPVRVVLAPFFCVGLFHSTLRRKVSVIVLTVGIVGLVLLVRLLDQPWRGLIDAGVVAGLAGGIVSLAGLGLIALTSSRFEHSPEVPEPT